MSRKSNVFDNGKKKMLNNLRGYKRKSDGFLFCGDESIFFMDQKRYQHRPINY